MGHVLIAIDAARLSAGAYDTRMAALLEAMAAEPARACRARAGWRTVRAPRGRRHNPVRTARRDQRAHRTAG